MRFFTMVCITTLVFSCNNSKNQKSKSHPNIITKDLSFIKFKMNVKVNSPADIQLSGTIVNLSKDVFEVYSPIIPSDTKAENTFSIFETSSLEELIFLGKNSEAYKKGAPADDVGYVVPTLTPANIIKINSKDSLTFQLNLYKLYNFKKFSGKRLAITFQASLPYIINGKQTYEIDSLDKKSKPVYYDLNLEGNNSIEKRVYFDYK